MKNKKKKEMTLSEGVNITREFAKSRNSMVIFFAIISFIIGGLVFVRDFAALVEYVVVLVMLFKCMESEDSQIHYGWLISNFLFSFIASAFINNWIVSILMVISFIIGVALKNLIAYKIWGGLKKNGSQYSFSDVKKGNVHYTTLPKELYQALKDSKLKNKKEILDFSATKEVPLEDMAKITRLLDVAKNLDPKGDNYESYMAEMSEKLYEIGLKLKLEKLKEEKESKEIASTVNEELMSEFKK